jgi:hypothetical protein
MPHHYPKAYTLAASWPFIQADQAGIGTLSEDTEHQNKTGNFYAEVLNDDPLPLPYVNAMLYKYISKHKAIVQQLLVGLTWT